MREAGNQLKPVPMGLASERQAAPDGGLLVSVVLPCLNEIGSVADCVDEALRTMEEAGIAGEVIVVDNGSTDGSPQAAAAHGARVVREEHPGYGIAVRSGIQAAEGQIVVMADADWTYPLHKIPQLIEPVVRGEADLVLGERLEEANRKSMPFLHRFVGTPVLTFIIARACRGLKIDDSQTGFRAFRRDTMLDLGLRATGMELTSDMLIRSASAGLRITTVKTGYRERVGESKLNTLSDGIRNIQIISGLAPHLLLVWPGAALLTVGLILMASSLLHPEGIALGSTLWQPVFFSSICSILGVQAWLAGLVLANRYSVVNGSVKPHFEVVGRLGFAKATFLGGMFALASGLIIDIILFGIWLNGQTFSRTMALAALAQTLIVAGGSAAVFSLVFRLVVHSKARTHPTPSPAPMFFEAAEASVDIA